MPRHDHSAAPARRPSARAAGGPPPLSASTRLGPRRTRFRRRRGRLCAEASKVRPPGSIDTPKIIMENCKEETMNYVEIRGFVAYEYTMNRDDLSRLHTAPNKSDWSDHGSPRPRLDPSLATRPIQMDRSSPLALLDSPCNSGCSRCSFQNGWRFPRLFPVDVPRPNNKWIQMACSGKFTPLGDALTSHQPTIHS